MQHNSLARNEQLEALVNSPFEAEADWTPADHADVLEHLILSASGWRTVFAADRLEHSRTPFVDRPRLLLACYAADSFAQYLSASRSSPESASGESVAGESAAGGEPAGVPGSHRVALATDARPTGYLLAAVTARCLLAAGHTVEYLGIAPTPQLLAYSAANPAIDACVCITASHNPLGHNGFKFGMADGGVLSTGEAATLTERLRATLASPELRRTAVARAVTIDAQTVTRVLAEEPQRFSASFAAYREQAERLMDPAATGVAVRLRNVLTRSPLGVVGELNGSARGRSIDGEFLRGLGLTVELLNAEPGAVVHQIVPEGAGLEDCRRALADRAGAPDRFLLGYVPDNDGDRGNLVYRPVDRDEALALGAQEVFALTCFAILSALAREGKPVSGTQSRSAARIAVVVNGPTSHRVDSIAARFGAEAHRAEVGEANVLALADRLREEGYLVPLIGEGSNGGAIIPPQRVRDPLAMLITLIKLLRPPDPETAGLSDEALTRRDIPSLLEQLPPWSTTSTYDPEALLQLRAGDHALLKQRYEDAFLEYWEQGRSYLAEAFGIASFEEHNYEGIHDRTGFGPSSRRGAEDGGLKILFRDRDGEPAAALWMRGSKTEPVMRIMAECRGSEAAQAGELLQLQRRLVLQADRRV